MNGQGYCTVNVFWELEMTRTDVPREAHTIEHVLGVRRSDCPNEVCDTVPKNVDWPTATSSPTLETHMTLSIPENIVLLRQKRDGPLHGNMLVQSEVKVEMNEKQIIFQSFHSKIVPMSTVLRAAAIVPIHVFKPSHVVVRINMKTPKWRHIVRRFSRTTYLQIPSSQSFSIVGNVFATVQASLDAS